MQSVLKDEERKRGLLPLEMTKGIFTFLRGYYYVTLRTDAPMTGSTNHVEQNVYLLRTNDPK